MPMRGPRPQAVRDPDLGDTVKARSDGTDGRRGKPVFCVRAYG